MKMLLCCVLRLVILIVQSSVMPLVSVSEQAIISDEQCNTLDKVSLCKIVDSVLNEERGSSRDESEADDDDISSDIDREYVGSDGGNQISSAIQIVPAKCNKVTQRRCSIDWEWMENQSVPVCILLISQWCSSRNCTQI
jgi:hypothetical protein